MAGWSGFDRRQFPRVIYPCLVVIRNQESGEEDVILTHTENIGIGGVCVILKQNVRIFCPVELELDLLDLGTHIKCKGKVVWNIRRNVDEKRKPLSYDIGIEFQDLVEKEQQRLEAVVSCLVKNQQESPYS